MLSVTILPLIYSGLLNLNPILVFKVLNPALFSLVPLGLYKLWSRFVGGKYAFASAFFFMTYQPFYTEMLGLNKQMIGELFLVLLLLVILNKKMKTINKTACFLIFSLALIVSHYALAEIFLVFIAFALILSILIRRPSRNITINMVFCFFVLMFCWYIYTSSSSVFDSFLYFGDSVYGQLGEFFDPTARQTEVLRGLGLEAAPTIWNAISRAFAYATEIFILIGFIGLIMKRTKIHVEKDYFVFISIAMVVLVALISVPGLASTMNMTRFYHILLFFIAPLCVVGAKVVVNLVYKHKIGVLTSILVLTVLVPYFLFQTGFVYEVTETDSWSVPLSKYRMNALLLYGRSGYTEAYNVFGPQWLSKNVAVGSAKIYADYYARSELRAYGMVYIGHIEVLSNVTELAANGIVYLSPACIITGKVVGWRDSWNLSKFHFFYDLNKVYSNGQSEIYKNQPQ
jgi:uncharacterized membrane protein